jgi:hypothetical protein
MHLVDPYAAISHSTVTRPQTITMHLGLRTNVTSQEHQSAQQRYDSVIEFQLISLWLRPELRSK